MSGVRKGFAACVADAGLSEAVTPHWGRHTAATLLMEANLDIWVAASYPGMCAITLELHYAHHRTDFHDVARRALKIAADGTGWLLRAMTGRWRPLTDTTLGHEP